jgi:Leucine-rich repeat (LRR) protein
MEKTISLILILVLGLTMEVANAELINIGDEERFTLDANVNLDWHNPATPWKKPVEITMTAGLYRLTFTDEVEKFTAWNAYPAAGWEYWIGKMWIFSSDETYASALLTLDDVVGSGSSQDDAFANASTLTFEFNVPTDQTGLAVVGDYDTNNDGGLTFYITKIGEIEEVDIPDSRLERAIREALHIWETDPITVTALEGLTVLHAEKRDIRNLTGLKYCVNLEKLYLYDNNFRDISELSELTDLQVLNLSFTGLRDISELSELTDLQVLNLSQNYIKDISALSELTDLQQLYLSQNKIKDISALSEMTDLWYLMLFHNEIEDISALEDLTNLKLLNLDYNYIENIVPLWNLTDLEKLWLGHNNISHIGSTLVYPLDAGDYVSLRANPLNYQAIDTGIPTLQDMGVIVDLYPPIEDLISALFQLRIDHDLTDSKTYRILKAPLEVADISLDKGYEATEAIAINRLSFFIDLCEKMRGKTLQEEDADYLILYAEDMIDAIKTY